ncbi:MAG: (Fe-S)-binding protein, partial [Candidatus Bathyarchaeia archaeon]
IESTGARKIVFSCPGCYRMFRQEYSRLLSPRVRMLHLVEFIDECVRSGKIKFKDRLEERVTYHDPCELARLCGVIEEPRRVLANFVTDFVELPENKFNVKCCGGGGLYKAVETATSLKIAGKRVEQAEKAGVATLVVACPSCNENLSQATYSKKSGLKVLDFAEVTASKIVSGMGS